MIKHVILWKLKDSLTENDKKIVKANVKRELEGLVGKVPGLNFMKIEIEGIESSTADMMLYSEFEDDVALKLYKDHPEHVRVADTYVRPYTTQRLCLDFKA